jgi:hypothetical protein
MEAGNIGDLRLFSDLHYRAPWNHAILLCWLLQMAAPLLKYNLSPASLIDVFYNDLVGNEHCVSGLHKQNGFIWIFYPTKVCVAEMTLL